VWAGWAGLAGLADFFVFFGLADFSQPKSAKVVSKNCEFSLWNLCGRRILEHFTIKVYFT